MDKSTRKHYLFTLLACGITAAGVLLAGRYNDKKIAVVDAVKLFNSYKMKAELEAGTAGRLKFLAHQADSLKQAFAVQSKVKGMPDTLMERLYVTFRKAEAAVEQEYQQSNQSINEQVWKRLNPLIDEYGKARGFRLIIGANGMGSVLYNDDYYDKTQELTDYVNKKYENGN